MKSLLLAQAAVGLDRAGHRLRRGGRHLDAVDRRRNQPRAREQIRALGATNIIIRSVKPSDEAQASGGNRPAMILNYGLKYSDYDRIVETMPTIRRVLPIREIRKQIRRGSYSLEGRVVGTTQDYADFNLLQMEKGRFLTASDNEKYENFAVLAAETAETLFPYEDPLGQAIKLGSDYYTVVGRDARNAKVRPASAAAWPPSGLSIATSTSR